MSKKQCERVGALIAPFLRQSGIAAEIRLAGIKKEWHAVFNAPLSSHIYPFSLKDGDLLINVDSPAWLQQVSFYKDEITKKLRAFGVEGVRFRLGRIVPADNANRTKTDPPSRKSISAEATGDIEEAVSGIKDQELREGIRKAMEKFFLKYDR